MGGPVDSLTPAEHIKRADAALQAAQAIRKEMDAREEDRGKTLGKASDWYLAKEHDFLTLTTIVNLHSNMATAKAMVALSQRSCPNSEGCPIELPLPGEAVHT